MRSEEYKRGYDAGYKQGLLDAIKQRDAQVQSLRGGSFKPSLSRGDLNNGR